MNVLLGALDSFTSVANDPQHHQTKDLIGAAAMIMLATLTVPMDSQGFHSTLFIGMLVIGGYLTFAITFFLLPPR
jgi:hypothetical protein